MLWADFAFGVNRLHVALAACVSASATTRASTGSQRPDLTIGRLPLRYSIVWPKLFSIVVVNVRQALVGCLAPRLWLSSISSASVSAWRMGRVENVSVPVHVASNETVTEGLLLRQNWCCHTIPTLLLIGETP